MSARLKIPELYFVYRHIRLDTNEVFYVGRGKVNLYANHKGYKAAYWRAYHRHMRNAFWKSVVNKTGYDIEIIWETTDYVEVCEKEKEFISIYGRRDLGTGTLVNLSEGGDGGHTMSEISKKMMIETAINNKVYEKLSEDRSHDFHVYDHKGRHVAYAKNNTECSRIVNCYKTSINTHCRTKKMVNGYIITREYLGETIDPSGYSDRMRPRKQIIKRDENKNIVRVFDSIKDAVTKDGIPPTTINRALKDGRFTRGGYWEKSEKYCETLMTMTP